MINLTFVMEQLDRSPDDEENNVVQGLQDLEKDRESWLKECYQAYLQKKHCIETVRVIHIVLPDSDPVQMLLKLDETFFIQLAWVYLWYGWPAIESICSKATESKTRITREAKDLVLQTCEFLRRRIALELVAIEMGVSKFAKQRWSETAATLVVWQKAFKLISKARYGFEKPSVAKAIISKFEKYQSLRKSLERSINERAKVDHLGRYIPGENDDEYPNFFRTWGKSELTIRNEMKDLAREIGKTCPAALFALEASNSVFAKKDTTTINGVQLVHSYNESELATEIMRVLTETVLELKRNQESLTLVGVSENATKQGGLGLPIARSTKEGGSWLSGAENAVAGRCLDSWSVGETIAKILNFELLPIVAAAGYIMHTEQNTVMGSRELVQAYTSNNGLNQGTSFQRCLLTHYIHALDSQMSIRKLQLKRFDFVMKAIRWIAATVAIVAFIALIVASDGALIPYGVLQVCSIIQAVNNAINLTLLVQLALEVKFKDEENDTVLRSAISELNSKDINTINDVGEALFRLHTARVDITKQMVSMLIMLRATQYNEQILKAFGLSNKLNLVQRAVELDSMADDLDLIVIDTPVVFEELTN